MSKQVWIYICGVHSLLFAVFHMAFWRLFKWRTQLRKMSHVNRAIMQVLNTRLIFIFLLFAFLCFAFPRELYTTSFPQLKFSKEVLRTMSFS
jgi:magnesium-transporting ATPase (P-type)